MKEITFEMAQELGLIPQFSNRFCFMLPFESRSGFDRRMDTAEIGYRLESARLKEDYKYVKYDGETLKVI